MDCAEARGTLWPPERLRVVDPHVAQARSHLSECACCQEYFRQDQALLDAYSQVRGISAPMNVRRRVFDSLAAARWGSDPREEGSDPGGEGFDPGGDGPHPGEVGSGPGGDGDPGEEDVSSWSRPSLRQSAWPLAPVALVALVALVGVMGLDEWGTLRTVDEPSAVFVEDYLRRAVGQEHIVTDDPGEIRHFLERELGLAIEPLAFAGFELARAEVCLLEGRLGAMIVYKGPNGSLSHYLVPRDDANPRPPEVSTSSASRAMPVVTWATPRLEQALVGELEAKTLLELTTSSLR